MPHHLNAFAMAASFSAAIGNWDMTRAFNINDMFNGASSFRHDLSGWEFGPNLTRFDTFARGSSLTADQLPVLPVV